MPDPDPGKSLGSGRIQIPLFLKPWSSWNWLKAIAGRNILCLQPVNTVIFESQFTWVFGNKVSF